MTYVLLRKEVPVQHWLQQLQAHSTAAPRFTSWAATYNSEEGLVYLHNVRSFYTRLLTYTVFQNDPRLEELAPSLASLARSVGG
ncbi:hypothetical protein OCL06_04695 [Alteromonas sp. ASW11-19]|uniref:Uncharacterized protein n=1 Tax=Alteromonas salexigens TaxID=2982530 RepID=A0ABT2VKR6_9ALTE|nr:hypothetical protein [Alteromonas salexigens]MCU7553891.1 hypothetical protein [Alteromonas salexigens]